LPGPAGYQDGVPAGFPASPEGALAQLVALDEQGLRGGDPAEYERVYAEFAAPGAPQPAATRMVDTLSSIRARAGLAVTGPVTDLTVGYSVTEGLIKGVLDGGRYTVVCVLGQLRTDYQGRGVSAGVGDCQAMRYEGGQWRISPGPAAARSSDAWPGSQDAVNVGYQELLR
jgi:hypothetical protein